MATWGALFKSYVAKEPVTTIPTREEATSEKIPIQPIVPLEYGPSQRTIEPIFIDEDEKPMTAVISRPGLKNEGLVPRKLFSSGASQKPSSQVPTAPTKASEIPRMANVVQQAQEAARTKNSDETRKLTEDSPIGSTKPNSSRIAKLFGYPIPSGQRSEQNLEVDQSGKPVAQAPFLQVEQNLDKNGVSVASDSAQPTIASQLQRKQSNASRVAKMFGYAEPLEPKPSPQSYKKPSSSSKLWDVLGQVEQDWTATTPRLVPQPLTRAKNNWAVLEQAEQEWTANMTPKPVSQTHNRTKSNWDALEQAELEWTTIVWEKPALKVEVPRENTSRTNISDLTSANSSMTTSSSNPFSAMSGTTATTSPDSLVRATPEMMIPEMIIPQYVLRAEEEDRKRMAFEVEQRSAKILTERQLMENQAERIRQEEEEMKRESERIAQEEFEMGRYIKEMNLPKIPGLDEVVQSPNREPSSPVDMKLEYPLRSPALEKATQYSSRDEEIPRKDSLGRPEKSAAKDRLDRLNAELEAERLKEDEDEEIDDRASDYASEYASVYESGVDEDDDNDQIQRSREETEKTEKEKAERSKRVEEEERLMEQRIAEEDRLDKEEDERLRLELEQAEKIEEMRAEAARRKSEALARMEEEDERREQAQREHREARREEERRIEKERKREEKEQEAKEEAQRAEEKQQRKEEEEAARAQAQQLEVGRQRAENEARQAEEAEDEPEETKEEQMRKAEEKIRQAFAGLAAERATPTAAAAPSAFSIVSPSTATPRAPSSLYRADTRGGKRPSVFPLTPVTLNRSATTSIKPGMARSAATSPSIVRSSTTNIRPGGMARSATTTAKPGEVGGGNLARAATTAGGRPIIKGGLPSGPKGGMGLPTGGPRGGALPRARQA